MALTRSRSADDRELERGRALVAELGAAFGRKSTAQHAAGVAQGAVAAVVGGLILIAGSVSVAGGNLGLADLLAFYAVIGLLLRTVAGSGGVSGQLVAGAESLRALYAVVDDPTPGPYALGGPTPVALCPLELRSVTFGYGDTGDAPVLRELDLVLEPGERVALIGPNGAGKSTIAGLLLGLRRPWSGTALAAGVPYDDLDVEVLRRRIGHVAQDVSLRPGTVRENVAFGRDPGVGDVERAAALAGVSDLLEVEVVDGGAPLSGGERQRVALARALVGGPEVLVLDEPGNHLDVAALERLTSALDLLEPPPAVLLITHQPTLAQWAGRTVSVGEAVGACRTDDTGIPR
jgi:ATP-binding cassette subfamily B protein